MNCPKCGKPLQPGTKVCSSCGTRIAGPSFQEIEESETTVLSPNDLNTSNASQSAGWQNQTGNASPYRQQPKYENQNKYYNNGNQDGSPYGPNRMGYPGSQIQARPLYGRQKKSGFSLASKILLSAGAACALLMIIGWFLPFLSLQLSSRYDLNYAMSDVPYQIRSLINQYISISGNSISVSGHTFASIMTSLGPILSSFRDTVAFTTSQANPGAMEFINGISAVSSIGILEWVSIIFSVIAAGVMLIPVFARFKGAKFCGLAGLVPLILSIITFVVFQMGVSKTTDALTQLSLENSVGSVGTLGVGFGVYFLLIFGVITAVCGIVPLFLKD